MIETILIIIRFLIIIISLIFFFWIIKRYGQKLSKEEEEADKLYLKKRFNEAIKMYERILSNNENNKRILFKLGFSYYLTGKNEKAIEKLTRIILLRGEDIYDMADTYILAIKVYLENNDFDSARQLFEEYRYYYEKIIQESPETIKKEEENIYLETKAWMKYKEGKIEESKIIYDKILPLWEKCLKNKRKIEIYSHRYSDLYYHFGIICKLNSEYKESIEWFQKSIKAGGPESVFSNRSKEELKELQK